MGFGDIPLVLHQKDAPMFCNGFNDHGNNNADAYHWLCSPSGVGVQGHSCQGVRHRHLTWPWHASSRCPKMRRTSSGRASSRSSHAWRRAAGSCGRPWARTPPCCWAGRSPPNTSGMLPTLLCAQATTPDQIGQQTPCEQLSVYWLNADKATRLLLGKKAANLHLT